jgi:hypothetical protein
MSEPAPRAERKKPPTPIPFTVLTGFLGAGKTTLLNRLLKDPALAETAVVINEFGEVGLDHLLVEYVSDNMVLLQSGCLCCTMRGDLVDALETLHVQTTAARNHGPRRSGAGAAYRNVAPLSCPALSSGRRHNRCGCRRR